MHDYLTLVRRILSQGEARDDRTNTGTLSVFGGHMEFDLRRRFPLLQHKETRWRVAFIEMLWFLRGDQSTYWLREHGVSLWEPWAKNGQIGPSYGYQWRHAYGYTADRQKKEVDQISEAIRAVKNTPESRRIIVDAWSIHDLPWMALPPCHFAHQLYVSGDYLDMQVYQRSWDIMLGAPFNIAQYALLLHLYARATDKVPRYLHFAYGDAHIYKNHIEGAKALLERDPIPDEASLVFYTKNTNIDKYKMSDFEIKNYDPEPFIKLEVAV